jgi:hypothetical protein
LYLRIFIPNPFNGYFCMSSVRSAPRRSASTSSQKRSQSRANKPKRTQSQPAAAQQSRHNYPTRLRSTQVIGRSELHQPDEELERTFHQRRRAAASDSASDSANDRPPPIDLEAKYGDADESPTPVFSPVNSPQPSESHALPATATEISSSDPISFLPLPLLWQYIPRRARQSFIELMKNLLTKYKAASKHQQIKERDNIIESILDVPRNYLLMKIRSHKRYKTHLKHRS